MADSALRGLVWVDFPLSTYLQIISRLALPAPYDIFFHAHEGGTGTCLGIGVPLSMGTQDGCVKEHTISPVRNVRRNYCPKAHVDSSRIWGYALCAWPGGPGTIGGRPTAYWNRHTAGEAVRKVFVHGIFSTGRIWEYVCGHLVLENPHPMRSAVRILPHLVRSNDGGGFHTPQDLPICGRWAFLHTVQYVAYGWLGSIP